jgi:hypothetical protein
VHDSIGHRNKGNAVGFSEHKSKYLKSKTEYSYIIIAAFTRAFQWLVYYYATDPDGTNWVKHYYS